MGPIAVDKQRRITDLLNIKSYEMKTNSTQQSLKNIPIPELSIYPIRVILF
jgi:hypothetical protein